MLVNVIEQTVSQHITLAGLFTFSAELVHDMLHYFVTPHIQLRAVYVTSLEESTGPRKEEIVQRFCHSQCKQTTKIHTLFGWACLTSVCRFLCLVVFFFGEDFAILVLLLQVFDCPLNVPQGTTTIHRFRLYSGLICQMSRKIDGQSRLTQAGWWCGGLQKGRGQLHQLVHKVLCAVQ